jgi:hypothetical protein
MFAARMVPKRRSGVALIALLLAVIWVPVTSHDFLSLVGWVHDHHQNGHEETTDHDFAHGCCMAQDAAVSLKAPTIFSFGLIAALAARALALVILIHLVSPFLAHIPELEPGWDRPWHFRLRLALPSRAP